MPTSKVGHMFVGETEWCQKMITGAFALSAMSLLKLTPDWTINYDHILQGIFLT
jgi:hypothetical protein